MQNAEPFRFLQFVHVHETLKNKKRLVFYPLLNYSTNSYEANYKRHL